MPHQTDLKMKVSSEQSSKGCALGMTILRVKKGQYLGLVRGLQRQRVLEEDGRMDGNKEERENGG